MAQSSTRYRFVRRIGVGGMAEVYAATSAGAAGVVRRVAIKRVLPCNTEDDEFLRMFIREARVASTLQHPNIVQTIDVLEVGASHLIVMELLDGLNLLHFQRHLRSLQRPVPPAIALYIITRILSALHYAHERLGIDGRPMELVHRDVSAHNVFISREGSVKLLDFGVAVAPTVAERQTSAGIVKGKVLYMAPELAQGQPIDRRVDLWAVGVVLYMMIAGRAPFRGRNPYDTILAAIKQPHEPLSAVHPSFDIGLDPILEKALAKSREDRYASARDMLEDLNRTARERNLVVTDVEFTKFVESVFETVPPVQPDVANLPADVVLSERGPAEGARSEGRRDSTGDGLLAETELATLRRVRGHLLFSLRGVIDERFDPEVFAPKLAGTVIIDTHAVDRITSYGLRGMLRLRELMPSDVRPLLVNCSVAFVQQLAMIRDILLGGRILSFYVPYRDSSDGHGFSVLLQGEEAYAALQRRSPPDVPSRVDPDRSAEFDEDADEYLAFLDDFQVEPPKSIAAVLRTLTQDSTARDMEMRVGEHAMELVLRRPIDAEVRWQRVLQGMEGPLVVDLTHVPSWTDEGVDAMLHDLSRSIPPIERVRFVEAPALVMGHALRRKALGAVVDPLSTVRLHTRCPGCSAARRVAVTVLDGAHHRPGRPTDIPCPACGETLESSDSLEGLRLPSRAEPSVAGAQPVRTDGAEATTIPWVLAAAVTGATALAVLAVGAAVTLSLWVWL